MEQSVKQVLKMMEQDGASLAKIAEMCKDSRPELIAQVEEFCGMYRTLAERYDHLSSQLYESVPSELQLKPDGDSDSPLLTPDHKPERRAGSVSSGVSFKEGSDSSSSSLSDSESESFNSSGNAYFSLPTNTPRDLKFDQYKLHMKDQDSGDGAFNGQENGEYEHLLATVTRYEEELRATKLKLQFSEDETANLKGKLDKSEALVDDLQSRLESATMEIKAREADLEVERGRVLGLEREMTERANQLRGQLDLEMNILKMKLDSESRHVVELQAKLEQCENDLSDRDNEIRALKVALLDAQGNFSLEKELLQSEILGLMENQNTLEERLNEGEMHWRSLEDKLKKSEATTLEMKGIHDCREIQLQREISQLKVEVTEKGGRVEFLNKDLDGLKFKHDMLMAEKDGLAAKINTLLADLRSRDDRIRHTEEQLRRLHQEHVQLIADSESARKLVDELGSRVRDMEKEIDRQRGEILARAEEKREAIRQLCFSLDYYRDGYKQLREAFLGHKRHAVVAS